MNTEIVKIFSYKGNVKRNSLINKEVNITTSLIISELANLYPESIKVVKGVLQKQGTWFRVDIVRWLSLILFEKIYNKIHFNNILYF